MTTRGRPFEQGQSGNSAGKRQGARNQTTLAQEALRQGAAESITRKAIEMAQAGDTVAMRFCLERLLPVRCDRPVTFELSPNSSPADRLRR